MPHNAQTYVGFSDEMIAVSMRAQFAPAVAICRRVTDPQGPHPSHPAPLHHAFIALTFRRSTRPTTEEVSRPPRTQVVSAACWRVCTSVTVMCVCAVCDACSADRRVTTCECNETFPSSDTHSTNPLLCALAGLGRSSTDSESSVSMLHTLYLHTLTLPSTSQI